MDLLRTDKTYKTRVRAMKALEEACDKLDTDPNHCRWLIAVNADGRFAPVVVGAGAANLDFIQVGVTVVA